MIRYFRKYEKYIFWGIVIVILPTFSVTGIMAQSCGRRDNPPAGELFGREVSAEEWHLLGERLAGYARIMREQASDRVAWHHLIFLERAVRAGVSVSDDELADRVKQIYKQHEALRIAYDRFLKDPQLARFRNDPDAINRIVPQMARAEAEKVPFDPDGYLELVERAGKTSPADFEHTLREKMMIEKLGGFVFATGKEDGAKLFDAYQEQGHKRRAVFVTFRSDDYPVTETATTTEDLEKYYRANPERFREPRRVEVEWIAFPLAAFEGEVPAPTDAEVGTRYEALKARYRIDRPQPSTGTAGAPPTPTAEYRPLAEVKGELSAEIRTEKKMDLAKKRAEAARARLGDDLAAGKAVSLTAIAREAGGSYGRSGLVEDLDLIYQRDIEFWNLLNTVVRLTPGGAGAVSEVAEHDKKTSAFFLRLLERRESHIPPLEEIAARVKESYLRGLDQELRQAYDEHQDRWKTPATASLEFVTVPYARLEKQVPADVTGTARAAELRRKAEAVLGEVRLALATKTSDGKARELDAVALDLGAKGVEHGTATVEKKGTDLPAALKAVEVAARLDGGADKVGELSPAYENEARTGLFAYVLKSHRPEARQPFAEVKEKVRADVLEERAYDRAKEAAEAFAKEAATKPFEFRAIAGKRNLRVEETGFLGAKDKAPAGLPERLYFTGTLFGLRELGDVSPLVPDDEARVCVVLRFAAKEQADPAFFAAEEKKLRESRAWLARRETYLEWETGVRLEAREIDEPVLREAYGLRYGPEGLAEVEAGHIYVAADAAVIKEELDKRARADAEAAVGRIRAGARFDQVARESSQDQRTRRSGGDMGPGFFAKGKLPRDAAAAAPEVEAAAFDLKPGEVSEPVKSRFGWHIVKCEERRGAEVRARHVLFGSERQQDESGEPRPLDQKTLDLALEQARAKIEKAKARLESGEDWAAVGKDLGEEPYSFEKRGYGYESPFERAALAAPPGEVSKVVSLGETHHLILAENAPGEEGGRGRNAVRPRVVRHIQASGQDGASRLEQARGELVERRVELEHAASREKSVRMSHYEFRKVFETLAQKRSEAPSRARGGEVGVFRGEPDLARWGGGFRDAVFSLKDGETSAIIAGREGYHIVKVFGRTKKTFEEARKDVAGEVLDAIEQ